MVHGLIWSRLWVLFALVAGFRCRARARLSCLASESDRKRSNCLHLSRVTSTATRHTGTAATHIVAAAIAAACGTPSCSKCLGFMSSRVALCVKPALLSRCASCCPLRSVALPSSCSARHNHTAQSARCMTTCVSARASRRSEGPSAPGASMTARHTGRRRPGGAL